MKRYITILISLLVLASVILSACTATPTPTEEAMAGRPVENLCHRHQQER